MHATYADFYSHAWPGLRPELACEAFYGEMGCMQRTFDVIYPHAAVTSLNPVACDVNQSRLRACTLILARNTHACQLNPILTACRRRLTSNPRMQSLSDVKYSHATVSGPDLIACNVFSIGSHACARFYVPNTRTIPEPNEIYMHASNMHPNPLACN